ncbi:uncharacterized protein LOC118491152 [Helianthus annuus]|uniref:uncharacterized protein LOC118491152 n=1 Tax=Helianthus annuus TaxID=4232 RepID=UPI001652E1A3|nr:uncharacterized protein LOC118491152 [Helianthus annuus]
MADKQPSSADNPTKPLHPVYTVTNIQNKVRVLDGDKVTYSDWVKLFKLHALAYDVLSHIDGSAPPSSTDPTYESWSKIDAIVLQWILGTLSDAYVKRVIDNVGTTQQAWDRLHRVFLNNKNARAATLEHAFTTTTMASCSSFNDYFQRMKDLADQLNDVDHPVNESRLVLQMVTGLPQEYDTVASFITQAEKSWDDVRDMIEREQRRQAARQSIHAALSITNAAPNQNTPPTPSPNPTPPPPYHPAQTYDTRNHTQSQNRGRGRQPTPEPLWLRPHPSNHTLHLSCPTRVPNKSTGGPSPTNRAWHCFIRLNYQLTSANVEYGYGCFFTSHRGPRISRLDNLFHAMIAPVTFTHSPHLVKSF